MLFETTFQQELRNYSDAFYTNHNLTILPAIKWFGQNQSSQSIAAAHELPGI